MEKIKTPALTALEVNEQYGYLIRIPGAAELLGACFRRHFRENSISVHFSIDAFYEDMFLLAGQTLSTEERV